MTTFLLTALIIGALIMIGLLINIYFYSHGVFRRRRNRRIKMQVEAENRRITTAELDEQYYSSLGIGPNRIQE